MRDGRNLKYQDIKRDIFEILGRTDSFCPYSVRRALDKNKSDGSTYVDTHVPPGEKRFWKPVVKIGTKSLRASRDNGSFVEDRAAVWCANQAFHESAHLWQYFQAYRYAYGNPLYCEMAKSASMMLLMPEYKKSAYLVDPSELHAHMYAAEQTKAFFSVKALDDPRYAKVDVDGALLDIAVETHGNAWPRIKAQTDVGSLVSEYSRCLVQAPYRNKCKLGFMCGIKEGRSDVFKALLMDADTIDAINAAPNGIVEADVLCRWCVGIDEQMLDWAPIARHQYVGEPLGKNTICMLSENAKCDMVPLPDWRSDLEQSENTGLRYK